jgi:hypothetical protein
MKILYRIDIDGKAQLQNDETDTTTVIKHASKRLGYVVTEFSLEIEGEDVEVVAMSPDTLMALERAELERLIYAKYRTLKQIKRIKL